MRRAINSTPDLDRHLAGAQQLGATQGQILSAIKIASAVKGTAQIKAQEAATSAMEATPGASENCSSGSAEEMFKLAGQPSTEERSPSQDCGPQCGCHSETKGKRD